MAEASWRAAAAREIKFGILARAGLVLAPLVLLALATGDDVWLKAAIVTISAFIGMARVGLAPLGVALHGGAILLCFSALLLALQRPVLFVGGCALLAGGAIALTAFGAKLRSLGNFTFIPALYLACELGENVAGADLWRTCLDFLPYAAAALLPVLLACGIRHARGRDGAVGWRAHFSRLARRRDWGERRPWREAMVAVMGAVAVAAWMVEWRHLDNGQWAIWSAASVVTGSAASAGAKLGNRALGAVIGVPLGILAGQLLPHDAFAFDLAVIGSILTIVAFSRYVVGFGLRCLLIALAFSLAGHSEAMAAARVLNVLLGGVIGVVFVLAAHGVAARLRRHFRADRGQRLHPGPP